MRVVYHTDFVDVELKEGEAYYAVPSSSFIKVILDNDEEDVEVFVNEEYIDEDYYDYISCGEAAQITIHFLDGKIRYYEVKPIAKVLAPEFSSAYGEFGFQFESSNENTLDTILSGGLKMYAVEQSAEIEDITLILNKMEDAYPAFKRICDKPKSHLKAINEIRTIDTVKRVGYESISYLASHSEDWLAKTASGLKPARLFSRVEDDEFQIYENRFVKTTIDLINSFLKHRYSDLVYKTKQLEGIISSRVQTNSFGFDAGFQKAVYELIPSDSGGDEHRTKQFALAQRLLKQVTLLWKKYRILHQSRLYKYLRRAKHVVNPINETNILVLDKNYCEVFKLWKDIQKEIAPKANCIVTVDEIDEKQSGYKLFCYALCEYAAHTMNFDQIGEHSFFREPDNLKITVREENGRITVTLMDATKRELKIDKSLVCPINDGDMSGKFEYRNQTLYWSNDTTTDDIEQLCAMLKKRESRGKEQAQERSRYIGLKSELEKKQREYGEPKSRQIVILPTFCEVEDESRNKFSEYMRRIASKLLTQNPGVDYAVIALPKCQNNEQKLTNYAKKHDEKIAFLPLTLFDINSYRRLQELFLRLILEIGGDKCPYCGSAMRENGSRRECTMDGCKLIVTDTACDEQSCRHKFTYLSYNVRQEVIDKMLDVDQDDFYALDSLFQYKDIADLSLGKKIMPICPKCGNC